MRGADQDREPARSKERARPATATEVVTNTPEKFRRVVRDSTEKNTKVIKAIGLKTE